jgi:uncharacterized membrane protein
VPVPSHAQHRRTPLGRASSGHSHGDVEAPALVRGRRALTVLIAVLAVATAVGMVLLRPGSDRVQPEVGDRGERVEGTVTAVSSTSCAASGDLAGDLGGPGQEGDEPGPADTGQCLEVTVVLDDGPEQGRTVEQVLTPPLTLSPEVGRGVVLVRDAGAPLEERYQLLDEQRGGALLLLTAVFALAVVALGRWRGALALVGLGVSVVVLVGWLVPALLAGRPPLLTAVVGASAVMLVVLFLAHGPSLRTATATAGTAIALALTLGLAAAFVELASLSGLTSDDAVYVSVTFEGVDVRGLLLAGIVIGALGILDDVTVTQVSTVWELRAANATLPTREVFAAALRVGRDHIASTVNTLLLAYAGASLPLLVIFSTSGEGLVDTLTGSVVGQEVVRTLVGSIGLVAAVPVTTALAALMCPPASPAPDPAADAAAS